ncbi:MAG: tetratricopeptide repeat protein, partial [Elusimicrobia bacterium]|nr:tetratricopeptide repeat protein [Elusimicrobiota bacterium]
APSPKPAEPVKPPEKPAQVFKSSLDETVKMDKPIKPAVPPKGTPQAAMPTPPPYAGKTSSSVEETIKLEPSPKVPVPPRDTKSAVNIPAKPEPAKIRIRKVSRKRIHPIYKVFLTLLFIVIVVFFSKNKITKVLVTNAEEKLLIPKYKSAANNFKIILKYEPRNTAVRFKLAQTYYKMRMHTEAEEEYKKILKIKPDMFQAMVELGKLNIQAGMFKEALSYLKRARSVSPESRDAKIYLGIGYEKSKEYDEAITEFKSISPKLESEELPNEAYLSMGKAWGVKGFHKEAKEFLKKAKLQKIAVEYFETGIVENEIDPDEAILNFTKAVVKKSDFLEAHEWLGLMYRKKGLYNSAIDCYQNVLAINPKLAKAYFSLSQLYALKDDKTNALVSLEKAVKLDKNYIKLAKNSYEFREMQNSYNFKRILKRR